MLIRIILFYCCLSLSCGDLVSLVVKFKETCALDIIKAKSEEKREEGNKEIEEKYTNHENNYTISLFNYVPNNGYKINSEKLISQNNKEISTPPPNC